MRTCVICGKRAVSGEHVFPAALGGRRKNKGIYCGRHNNAFSKHVSIISGQLKLLNALLAVKPDHSKSAKPHQFTSDSGEQITVFNGETRRVKPPTVQGPNMIDGHMEFGGPEALRAVGYIALTFFAHHYPEESRRPELHEIREFIEKETPNEFVWWEGPETSEALPRNPFAFGHTIILQIAPESGNITALVSFFEGITFGVYLGSIPVSHAQSTVIFIDPQADHPPDDIQVERQDQCLLPLQKPKPLQAHLERIVQENVAADGIDRLLQRISRWKFEARITPLKDRLNATRERPRELQSELESMLMEMRGYIFQLLNYLVLGTIESVQRIPESERIIGLLKQIATQDATQTHGVAPLTEASMFLAMETLKSEITSALRQGPIDMDQLFMLFRTTEGVAIVGRVVLEPLFSALQQLANETHTD